MPRYAIFFLAFYAVALPFIAVLLVLMLINRYGPRSKVVKRAVALAERMRQQSAHWIVRDEGVDRDDIGIDIHRGKKRRSGYFVRLIQLKALEDESTSFVVPVEIFGLTAKGPIPFHRSTMIAATYDENDEGDEEDLFRKGLFWWWGHWLRKERVEELISLLYRAEPVDLEDDDATA
jgi:hypothetical protein